MAVSALSYSHVVKPSFINPAMASFCVNQERVSFCSPSFSALKFQSSTLNLKRQRYFSKSGEGNEEDILPIEKRPAFPTVMDIKEIKEILIHRYPFLLVDRVIQHNPGVSIVGIKNVSVNESFFVGHFPGDPIMPGVLIVEAMAQVSCLVLMQPEVGFLRDKFLFRGIDKVRFRKQVTPGDTLVIRVTITKVQRKYGLAKLDAKAYVGGELACEGEITGVGEFGGFL